MRWAAKRDANEGDCIAYLEAHGAQVEVIGRPMDLLIAYHGVTAVADVKNVTGRNRLQKSQKDFLDRWTGLAAILRSDEDCQVLLGRMWRVAHGSQFSAETSEQAL